MNLNKNLILKYNDILCESNIIEAYQEFIKLFKTLHKELKNKLPNYNFQNKISENILTYSYFSFTNDEIKKNKLKFVVVFMHKTRKFELWLSGMNRSVQINCNIKMKENYLKCENPIKNDYIYKTEILKLIDFKDINNLIDLYYQNIIKMNDSISDK